MPRFIRPFGHTHLRSLGFAALVATWAAAPTAAQTPVTLDQAIDAALASNPRLRAARAGADEAHARRGATRGRLWPTVRFVESWQRGNQPVFVFSSLLSARQFTADNFAIPSLNEPNPVGFFRSTLGLEHVFFDGGRLRATATAATAEAEIADLAVSQAMADLAVETTRVFGRAIVSRAAARAAESALEAARDDQARVETRRAVGMATDADVLEFAVHVADLEARRIRAHGEAAVAEAELNRLMGTPVTNSLDLVQSWPASARPSEDLTALLAEARRSRPEVAQAEARARQAEAGIREARAGLVPRVAGQALLDASGTSAGHRTSAWLIGGELSWQLSVGGSDILARRAAVAASARAAADRDAVTASIDVEVIAAYRGLEAALAREAVGRAAVDQARESQRIIRDRFEAGLAGTQDVLRASAAVLSSDATATTAAVDVLVGEAELRRAVGRRIE